MSIPSSNAYKDTYRNVLRYTGQNYRFVPTYLRNRDPIAPQNQSPDVKPFEQQGFYPVSSLWTNVMTQTVWLLAGISNGLANWINISASAAGTVDILTSSGVVAPVGGQFNFTSTDNSVVISSTGPGIINFSATPVLSKLDFRLPGALDVFPLANVINFASPSGNVTITRTLPNTINFDVPGLTSSFSTDLDVLGFSPGLVVPNAGNIKIMGHGPGIGTQGLETRAITTAAANDTVLLQYVSGFITTNNNTATEIVTLTISAGSSGIFSAICTGFEAASGLSFGSRILLIAKRIGAVTTIVTQLENVSSGEGALNSCTFSAVVVGVDIQLQVRGRTGRTISWGALVPWIDSPPS